MADRFREAGVTGTTHPYNRQIVRARTVLIKGLCALRRTPGDPNLQPDKGLRLSRGSLGRRGHRRQTVSQLQEQETNRGEGLV